MISRDEVRVFIAVELPSDLKSLLRDFESKLIIPGFRCARWVDPAAIHLTLKFLGNVSTKILDEIKREVEIEVRKSRPFTLSIGETGCFPNLKRPRVFWIGLCGETDKLLALQANIDEATGKLGFPKESRPFTAHLTLARLRDDYSITEKKRFADAVEGAAFGADYSMLVNSVSLIRSQLRPEGALYTRLSEFGLSE